MPKLKRTRISSAVMVALGGALVGGVPSLASAQDVQRVEITGSRIISPNAESPSPLQVLTAEDIAASGVTNVQELLLKNPTFGVPGISRTNSNFQTASVGVALVDLRNLGSSRTLVLVNGRRYVSGVPGSAAVDLETIPTDFVERIEILTGGASSAYGSDAVAGVVNIILKRDYQGFILDASGGESERGDDETRKLSLTWGANVGGKGNVMAHIGYAKQGAVFGRDRAGGETDSISLALLTGDFRDMFTRQAPFFSSFAPQGRVFGRDLDPLPPDPVTGDPHFRQDVFTFDADGNQIPFSTNGPAGDGVGATGFNRQAFRYIAAPTERYTLATKGEWAINDNHSTFFEGTYASTKAESQLEPFPLAADDVFPATGGQVPAEFLVGGVLLRNPIVTPEIYDRLDDSDGDGARDYFFTRRMAEIGGRGSIAERDTFRILGGVKGTVFGGWDYEVYTAYGITKEGQRGGGQVNVLNMKYALQAVPDVDDLDGDGDVAEPVCLDADAREQGCVPLNVFGFNSITPEAAAYIQAPSSLNTSTTQKLFGAIISGEPLNLPAGPLGMALGLEYRDEFSSAVFDALTQAGLNAGNAQPPVEGSFDVKELFVETRVPILKNVPFAKSLAFSGAVRGGDYSSVGSTLSWNAGLEWAPISDLKFRATRAQATRAPDIGELFTPPSETFPPGLQDPCEGVTATSTGPFDDRCRAIPGIAANIAANGSFLLNQADKQGIGGFNRGNPLLQEETGNSTTIGLVWTPKSIPVLNRFSFTADYFDIDIEDAIVPTPRQFILEQCYNASGDATFCDFITRRPTAIGANSAGSIDEIDSAVSNSGGFATKGVDLTASYANRFGPGMFSSQLSYTRVIDGYLVPLPGSPKDYFAGEIGAAKDKFLLNLGYDWGPWGARAAINYIGESALDDQFLSQFCGNPDEVAAGADCIPLTRGSVTVPSKVYTDIQLTYKHGKVKYYLGVDNLFDTSAPYIDGNLPGGVTGAQTAADVYDAIGRRYYLGVRIEL